MRTPRVATGLLGDPRTLRTVAALAVRVRPVVVTPSRAVVLRHADVCDVLARDGDFTVEEANAAPMLRVNGPFILGMDRSPRYERERGILERCVRADGVARIRAEVVATAEALVARVRPSGRIDVVGDLARPAALALVSWYLGVAGPDPATMARWMRTTFREAFLNLGGDEAVRRAGEASGRELHTHLDDRIERRRAELAAGAEVADDLLTRLLVLQGDPATHLADEGVRRNLSGVIVGAVETTAQATVQALDQLLRRPAALRTARAAALAGDLDVVAAHTFEALRFHPVTPVLLRHTARPTVIARGTRWERALPAGLPVYLGVLAAMFDPAAHPHPHRFDAGRDPALHLHFGAGTHTCLGRHVNLVQVPELVAAVLRLEDLRVPVGPGPRTTYDGPFPDRFELVFRPRPERRQGAAA